MGTAKSLEGGDSVSRGAEGKLAAGTIMSPFRTNVITIKDCPLGLKILHGPVLVHTGVARSSPCPVGAGAQNN